uniref:Uncharacterized protein n=1 Tax=Leersia perrieri TaxID=77586 RepID=A0A0D9WDH0_9ORYZ
MFERRLPFFGCGIGWCWFLVPLDLVRCSYSLLLQVLQPGSSRATRTCCFCCSGKSFVCPVLNALLKKQSCV